MATAMIGRESGQDELAVWGIEHKPGVLERINEELEWRRFEKPLHTVFKDSGRGRKSYPPVLLFKALLLQMWYGLSDPMAEKAIADRLSFRRFLRLGLHIAVPDETTLCRFQGRLPIPNRIVQAGAPCGAGPLLPSRSSLEYRIASARSLGVISGASSGLARPLRSARRNSGKWPRKALQMRA